MSEHDEHMAMVREQIDRSRAFNAKARAHLDFHKPVFKEKKQDTCNSCGIKLREVEVNAGRTECFACYSDNQG